MHHVHTHQIIHTQSITHRASPSNNATCWSDAIKSTLMLLTNEVSGHNTQFNGKRPLWDERNACLRRIRGGLHLPHHLHGIQHKFLLVSIIVRLNRRHPISFARRKLSGRSMTQPHRYQTHHNHQGKPLPYNNGIRPYRASKKVSPVPQPF